MLSTVDTLINTDSQAALDLLNGVNSEELSVMDRGQKTFYDLLLTEAKYKCYLPIAEDTMIFSVSDYYLRHGKKELLARSLMMQGAVLVEREEPALALGSFLKAEPLMTEMGNLEQLGLLNTKIGGLYQSTYVNNDEAAYRFRKALECFRLSGKEERVMYAHLSLARVLISSSPDSAYSHIKEGMRMALERHNHYLLLAGYELLTHLYLQKADYRGIIRISDEAMELCCDGFDDGRVEQLCQSILFNKALSYAYLGKADSAICVSAYLQWSDTDEDRMMRNWLASVISESKYDWPAAFKDAERARKITDSLEKDGSRLQLENKEFALVRELQKKEEKKQELSRRVLFLSAAIILLLLLAGLICIFFRNRKLHKVNDSLRCSITSYNISDSDAVKQHITQTSCSSENEEVRQEVDLILKSMLDLVKDINELSWQEGIDDVPMSVKDVVDRHFPKKEVYPRIRKVCDILYPGKLLEVESEAASLTDTDKLLIALMGCGFPTGAICALMRLTKASLNVQKTRTARKIGPQIRLSEYVAEKFSKNGG